MYCSQCGVELRGEGRFCSDCGARVTGAGATGAMPPQGERVAATLMLDKRNNKLAGVCAGFARYFGIDVVLMRVLWLAFAFCTGMGFIVYIAAWIIVPSDRGYEMGRNDAGELRVART